MLLRMFLCFLRAAPLLLLCWVPAYGQSTLRIAAAADLSPALKELVPAFERVNGVKVEIVPGSSGNLYAQIRNGAPYDLFFSADQEYAKRLLDEGIAEALTPYAEGSIVLWVRNDSRLELTNGMKALMEPSVKKIAIANPVHAPYGRAAVGAMEHSGVSGKVKDKLVLGENVSQAAEFVQTGNADIGIIALSLALSPALKSEGRYWVIPRDSYPRLQQAAVVLRSSEQRAQANRFLAYLKTASAIEIFKRYGFRLPTSERQ